MIVVMGNVNIRALSVCRPRAGWDPPWERLGLRAPQPQLSTHVQTLPGGTALPHPVWLSLNSPLPAEFQLIETGAVGARPFLKCVSWGG